jgi:hypothetical protein
VAQGGSVQEVLAEETSLLAIRINAELNRHLIKLQSQLDATEFQKYRRGFGEVMGALLIEVVNPIYSEHPNLKPTQMGGPYVVPAEVLGSE